MSRDRITIATDMARERREAAGLGNGELYGHSERPDGSVRIVAALVVSADDIDAQIALERERGVERKAEDARPVSGERLTEEYMALVQHSAMPALELGAAVDATIAEIRDSRAAIARVEALIERLRRISTAIGVKYADDFEAALRGDRSDK